MRNKRWKVGRRGTRTLVVAELNMRMQPKHRHEMEDAWEDGRDEHGLPSIVGGGTLQSADGEPIRADIEFEFDEAGEETLTLVARVLTAMGAAAGSVLRVRSEPDCALTFGHNEGLAVYLNGTDLSETALYFYGPSYATMHDRLVGVLSSHPLCERCRVVQIAW
jgi:hypothetical protein